MIRTVLAIVVACGLLAQAASAAPCPGCNCPPGQQCTKAELLVAFPDYVNTPDGMALLKDGSIVVSVPNFNDETKPPLLMRVTGSAGKAKAEKFYEFPNPYPGLPQGLDRISPMGIVQAPSGDLYFADMQIRKDISQKSRLWRLVMKGGKPQKMVLVAKNFNVANGLCIRGGYLYITDSVLEPGANPLPSAVLRFKLTEENVELKTPLKNDPHIIATFTSKKMQWPFGADGIDFDNQGNLYVGLFGEGQMFKITFDKKGNVVSNTLFAEAPGKLINCDGMHLDKRTNKLYMADSAANAVQVIDCKTGKVETLDANEDVTDKRTGGMDQPCEALVRGKEIIVSNMDWPFPGFKNTKWQQPATLSVIKLKK
jgi:sugar lactone lactonase YvrE